MINRSLRISKTTLLIIGAYILEFVNMANTEWLNYLKYGIIIILSVFVFKRYNILIKRKFLSVNIIMILFSALIIISSFINRYRVSGRNIFLSSLVFCLSMTLVFLLFEILTEMNSPKMVIKVLRNCAIVETVICDFLLLVMPSVFWTGGINCIIGSKFSMAYLHLWMIAFIVSYKLLTRSKLLDLKLVLLFLWTAYISVKVDCVTGIVGSILLVTIIILSFKYSEIFLKPCTVVLLLAFCFTFIFAYDLILNIPSVNNLIVNIFEREGTMSSRLSIYALSLEYLKGNFLWGIGYGSSYEIGMAYSGFADTQNSILEWIWQSGIPATVLMLTLFIIISYKIYIFYKRYGGVYALPVVGMIYTFILLGTVEITMNNTFFGLYAVGLYIASFTTKQLEKEGTNNK